MKALVTYGSRRGGTAAIAAAIADVLRAEGHEVDCVPVARASGIARYDAIVIGGALYAHRWPGAARRFVHRHADVLRARPVWLFSSGPLDDSASRGEIAAVPSVARLLAHVGARGHATFGGRLANDAKGFPASAMAKTRAGDWRDWGRIRSWAGDVARDLAARPYTVPFVPVHKDVALATLCLATGASALAGGLALIAGPDGRYVRTPVSLLRHAPFGSFLVPGVMLFVIVGLANLMAGIMVRRRHPWATEAAFGAGLVLWGWIVSEMLMLRAGQLHELIYLAVSLAIMGLALLRHHRESAMPALPGNGNAHAA
ncbi:MAG TPA: flavodoxin domain-containing protein [Kofleriaceae bacterium]|nr:flavodoxin domain-containing protein [Kofleriaceae bacterium]